MITEYAIEPEVMACWTNFHSMHGDFGVGQGRLICDFPEGWRRRVLKHAAVLEAQGINSPRQAQMLLDQFDRLKCSGAFLRSIVSSERISPSDLPWCEAARNASPAFDVIVHGKEPQTSKELKAGDFVKTIEPFFVSRQVEVKRGADDLIDCGWSCYRRAKEICVVDPYFSPAVQKFGKVLGRLLTRLERAGKTLERLEVHTKLPTVYNPALQRRHWEKWAESQLPSNWKLKVVHWDKLDTGSEMHARYILTDFGGLDYNWGTDEKPDEVTQVGLLDDAFWAKLHQRFCWRQNRTPKMFDDFPDRIFEIAGRCKK